MAKDIKGQKVLKTLMTWSVSMTKEHRKFQVTLCSSDSFMHNWLTNFTGNDRIPKENNKKAAENWKFLSCEEKQRYFEPLSSGTCPRRKLRNFGTRS